MTDAGAIVLITDRAGQVLLANDEASRRLCAERENLIGRSFHDFFPPDFADERIGFIQRVLETRRPLAVIGMVGGSRSRTLIRPMPGAHDEPDKALIVCSPVTQADHDLEPDGYDVATATVNDMGPLAALSERELDVLTLLGGGMSTAETAKVLSRTVKTVQWHRTSIGRKLGVTNRAELAGIAHRAGLFASSQTGRSSDTSAA